MPSQVVVSQTPGGSGGSGGCGSTTTTPTSPSSVADPDPAAEWLYLLYCRFVQERLCHDLYANVGIRAGGRRRRRKQVPEVAAVQAADPSLTAAGKKNGREESGTSAVGSGDRVTPGGGRQGQTGGGSEGLGGGGQEADGDGDDDDDEDFFFPVTPEQLIALNLAELAAGKMNTNVFPARWIAFCFVLSRSLSRLSPPTGTWLLSPCLHRSSPQQ